MSRLYRGFAKVYGGGIRSCAWAIGIPIIGLALFSAVIRSGISYAQYQIVKQATSAGVRAARLSSSNCDDAVMATDAHAAANEFGGRMGLPEDFGGRLAGSCTDEFVTYSITFERPSIVPGLNHSVQSTMTCPMQADGPCVQHRAPWMRKTRDSRGAKAKVPE